MLRWANPRHDFLKPFLPPNFILGREPEHSCGREHAETVTLQDCRFADLAIASRCLGFRSKLTAVRAKSAGSSARSISFPGCRANPSAPTLVETIGLSAAGKNGSDQTLTRNPRLSFLRHDAEIALARGPRNSIPRAYQRFALLNVVCKPSSQPTILGKSS